jgi:hypothetical protein
MVLKLGRVESRPPPAKFLSRKKLQNFEKTPPPMGQKKVKKKHLFSCVFLRFCHTTSMKDKESTTSTLDQIIADAKARREQEQREHQEIMAKINELKNGSIFAK